MASTSPDRTSKPKLTPEEKKLIDRGEKLAKLARYVGNSLNVMLTVLNAALAGVPIAKNIAGSALATLEIVQTMDDNHGLIALVLVDVVETSYIVLVALQNSDEGQAPVADKDLMTHIETFQERLKVIKEKLIKLLKRSRFSRFTQIKGYNNDINDLREELKKERDNLHLYISALTYRGTVCKLPVDPGEVKEYAGKLANSQLQAWKWQQEHPNGIGSGAVVNSQVGTVTAEEATKNAVGCHGMIYNGENSRNNSTVYNFTGPRGKTKHTLNVGSIGNYNAAEVNGTLNQGCNTMYFGSGYYSQEPAQVPWQQ